MSPSATLTINTATSQSPNKANHNSSSKTSSISTLAKRKETKSKPNTNLPTTRNAPKNRTPKDGSNNKNKNKNNPYARGQSIPLRRVRDRKLRADLTRLESGIDAAATAARDADAILRADTSGYIVPEGELERTFTVRQDDIRREVPLATAQNGSFELALGGTGAGPYVKGQYTRSGRGLLLASQLGHIATVSDWRAGKLGCEMHLQESVRDVTWLHDERTVAVALKKYVHVYDMSATGSIGGVQLHVLRKHIDVTHLLYQPYHFLLASIGHAGWLKYTDVSTGQLVAELATKQGSPTAFAQNRRNAILHVGHQNGTVTLWSPNCSAGNSGGGGSDGTGVMGSKPLVKLLAQRGPIRCIDVDRSGRYMVSAGQDRRMAVWDIRMFREIVREVPLYRPANALTISDTGIVAAGSGSAVTTWKAEDIFLTSDGNHTLPTTDKPLKFYHRPPPYMTLTVPSPSSLSSTTPAKTLPTNPEIHSLAFCPYEDTLGTAHTTGFSTSIVPGAGEPNFDAREPGTNPYASKTQVREAEVHALLDKIQPEMIALEPNYVGKLDPVKSGQDDRALYNGSAGAGANSNGNGIIERRSVYARPPTEYERDSALMRKFRDRHATSTGKAAGKNSALRAHMRKRRAKNVDVIDARRTRVEEFARKVREERKRGSARAVGKGAGGKGAGRGKEDAVAELGPALARFVK